MITFPINSELLSQLLAKKNQLTCVKKILKLLITIVSVPLEDEIPVKFTFFRRAYFLPNTSPLTILRNVYNETQLTLYPQN